MGGAQQPGLVGEFGAQYRIIREVGGGQLQCSFLDVGVRVPEGLAEHRQQLGGGSRVAAQLLSEQRQLGTDQLLLGAEEDGGRHLGEQAGGEVAGCREPGQGLLGVPGHGRRGVGGQRDPDGSALPLLFLGRAQALQDGLVGLQLGGLAAAQQAGGGPVEEYGTVHAPLLGEGGQRGGPVVGVVRVTAPGEDADRFGGLEEARDERGDVRVAAQGKRQRGTGCPHGRRPALDAAVGGRHRTAGESDEFADQRVVLLDGGGAGGQPVGEVGEPPRVPVGEHVAQGAGGWPLPAAQVAGADPGGRGRRPGVAGRSGDHQGRAHQVPFLPAVPARGSQFTAQLLQLGEQNLVLRALQRLEEPGQFVGAARPDGFEDVVGGVHRAAPVEAGAGAGVARRAMRVARACLQGPRRPR